MSDVKRKKLSRKQVVDEYVPVEEKTQCLQTAIYGCTRDEPFLGSVLQCLNIMYSHFIPTAGIMFNTEAKRWDMYINPKFFCHKLNKCVDKLKKANGTNAIKSILVHELSHITNKHPFRVPFLKISERKRRIMNVAADMAINQFIKHLPTGCIKCSVQAGSGQYKPCGDPECPGRAIFVQDFKDKDEKTGKETPWKTDQIMEFYYEKLLEMMDESDDDDEDGECLGCGQANGQHGQTPDGKPCPKGHESSGQGKIKGIPDTLDEHMWDGSGEEKDMLEATEDLIKRAMIKQRCGFDELPRSVRELLEHIETRKVELNYKAEILAAIKKSASGHERKHTWTRKSRRFGNKAPGTRVGDLPKLHFYLDSSGSISIEELNEFLEVADNFLRAGSRKCRLNLFHTSNYFSAEYKLGQRIGDEGINSIVQSGGTCLEDSLKECFKRKPDLAVFVTDGYYGDVAVEEWLRSNDKFPQVLFIISKGGTDDHPLKRLGKTIKIPDTA
jgi:predicted metal-dependent peptidase